MRERPILFSAPMVNAVLAGEKTQTRRVVKNSKVFAEWDATVDDAYKAIVADDASAAAFLVAGDHGYTDWVNCPYGKRGDRLWVKETWRTSIHCDDRAPSVLETPGNGYGWPVWYSADNGAATWRGGCEGGPGFTTPGKMRPSIFMPRWASRITLEVAAVRVERLRDISEDDAQAEGVEPYDPTAYFSVGQIGGVENFHEFEYRAGFFEAWRAINGEESFDANPWVWVVEFKRIESSGT